MNGLIQRYELTNKYIKCRELYYNFNNIILFYFMDYSIKQLNIPSSFSKEKDLQSFVEQQCLSLFNYKFVWTEITIKDSFYNQNNRFDSIAINEQDSSIQILEYKFKKDSHVIDQITSYLSTLNNEFDIIEQKVNYLLNNNPPTNFSLNNSWVTAIVPELTEHQKKSFLLQSENKNLSLYFWKISNLNSSKNLHLIKFDKSSYINWQLNQFFKNNINWPSNNNKISNTIIQNINSKLILKDTEIVKELIIKNEWLFQINNTFVSKTDFFKEILNNSHKYIVNDFNKLSLLSFLLESLSNSFDFILSSLTSQPWIIYVKNSKDSLKLNKQLILFNINLSERKFWKEDNYFTIVLHPILNKQVKSSLLRFRWDKLRSWIKISSYSEIQSFLDLLNSYI